MRPRRQDHRSRPAVPGTAARLNSASALTRRSFLTLGTSALALGVCGRAAAASPGVPFGAAIQSDHFDDETYRQLFLDHCDMIVPMNELKFGLLQWERGEFDFTRADMLVDFARENGRTSRGHTFVWHSTNPPWLETITDAREGEAVLVEHIERVADHFRGRLTEWDVVNEVISNDPTRDASGALRDTVWTRLLGPRHIPIAFQAAARADPGAALVVNDYGLEPEGEVAEAKRRVMLDLVRQLQDANIRVDAVGLQAHLYAHFRVDVEGLGRFKEELERLGVGLTITELDVIDFQIHGGSRRQDRAAARVVSDLLDAVLAGPPPRALVTWGITDRHSWVDGSMPHADGTPSRPLPLDANDQPKAWYLDLRRRLTSAD